MRETRARIADLVIRSAVAADIDSVRDIYRHASLTNKADHDLIAAHPEWLVWDDSLLPFVHVAVSQGRVVGFATARPVDDFLELEDLFIDPECMRQGVASALIAVIASRGMRIEVSANHARAFYESAGFVVVGSVSSNGGSLLRMRLDAAGA
ncbi:GNAT family N-acetyltransferase [Paenibacillus albus]|uniref:GNAT family N-acetyltransferase n=2 Tax=Paenibacillus albus TaxID=2495582 RepID=A0A3S9AD74_9BACL|nr:GNAT family N-acetyltransferase [Paenibacillus albus]